jgi:spore coat protein U-like protein
MNWGFPKRSTTLRTTRRAICAALACALPLAPAGAKEVATGTGSSSAVVVEPLSLIKVQDLSFGKIVPRPTAGTVTVNEDTGACTVTGAIMQVGSCRTAQFTGMGRRNMTVRFTLPSTVTLTSPGGATMIADTLTVGSAPDVTYIGGNGNGNGAGNRRYRINPPSGIFTFRVGARLNVGANQAPGIYTGTFNVTVQYN